MPADLAKPQLTPLSAVAAVTLIIVVVVVVRYPLGEGNPSFILGQLPLQSTPHNSSSSMSSAHIELGEALDKQLCFHGSCSLAVLQPGTDAELALAAVNTAMREMHR